MLYAGLDLGQKHDFSAIAVVEREDERRLGLSSSVMRCLRVRHLERVPLGTAYAAVAGRVSALLAQAEFRQTKQLVVDATGVGGPVVELLRTVWLPCPVTSVTITAGDAEHGRGNEWHVPKRDLLMGLAMLLEQRQLKIPRGLEETGALVRELTEVEVRRGADGGGGVGTMIWRWRWRWRVGGGRRLRLGLGRGGWFEGQCVSRLAISALGGPPERTNVISPG
jgi:hypothetical protein